MTVLFTKKIDEQLITERLQKNIQPSFTEVLKFKIRTFRPFPLHSNSIIFTSVNGVEAFFQNHFLPKENFAIKPYNKIYCVGTKTRLKIREFGFGVFKTCKNAKELCEFIIEKAGKEQFIHFCGNLALDILDKKLPLQNINYKKLVCYDTELLYPQISEKYDALVFFSPSGVRSFAKYNSLENCMLFSIGDTTSEEIKNFTNQNIITSKDQNLKSLLELINNKFEADFA
ncbi:uroporphyrinogen-III synthase [Halpernia sp.]|uniref:uroporphyrinogen-III synthase n=1 Tax=Halpernia sp. TaxID=2782209 RepID=UPI003A8F0627